MLLLLRHKTSMKDFLTEDHALIIAVPHAAKTPTKISYEA